MNRFGPSQFTSLHRLAIAGVSRNEKFGNTIHRELTRRGYDAVAVNPNLSEFDGGPCYPDLKSIPGGVEGVVVATSPHNALNVLRDAAECGIRYAWVQQGGGSNEAKSYCDEHGIEAVFGECILMYAGKPTGIHAFHRWLWGLMGRLR
ncbi:MAG: CoA-binding protein [bacterium]|nr:CoA-binding protein [bacterium]